MTETKTQCSIPVTTSVKQLWMVLGLRSFLFVIELGTGLWIQSLSLLAIAGHLFVDVLAIGIALVAASITNHPATRSARLNPDRVEAWAALINSLILLTIAGLVIWGTIVIRQSPSVTATPFLLGMAVLGLLIKATNATLLYEASHHNLNVRGVFLHAIADAAGSISLIFTALAIVYLDWRWADRAGGLLVALLMIVSAVLLIKASLQTLRSPFSTR